MLSQTTLKTTPLYEEHLKNQGRMVAFGGWQMPVQYEGILAEYAATRRAVTVFDTCHMGEFLLEGDCLKSGFDRIISFKMSDMKMKTCRYGLMLNEKGGVMDDLIVYRLAREKWMIVVNAANIEKDAAHISAHLTKEAFFNDISAETGKLDIQGPLARGALKGIVPAIEKLEYYGFDHFQILGQKCLLSRTGYTGELGYEIYCPAQTTVSLWRWLLEKGMVKPAGLGARDVLRTEMGYSLYGQDLDESISPLEAGLGRFVDFEKEFIGADALRRQKKEGPPRAMICFASINRRSPRHHHKIFSQQNKEIGVVTSGTFSPALEKGVGMGLLDPAHAFKGERILFGDQNNSVIGEIVNRPFYKNGSLKN